MSVIKTFIFLLFVTLLTSAKVWGQAASSPFTTYGIGEQYGNALIHNQGMGGVGVSQPQFWHLNNQNPALLVYNTFTVFQAGIVGESRTISGNNISEKNTGGNLNYLATAFPIKPGKWTSSVGLMPYTNVDYKVQYNDFARNDMGVIVDTFPAQETGSGGLTQLYWSNGVRITPEMSVGLKATYLFGPVDIIYANEVASPDQAVPFIVNVREKTSIKDFTFGLGYSFSKDSLGRKKNYRFSAGGVYNFGTNLKAKRRSEINRTTLGGTVIEADTLASSNERMDLPPSFTVGVSFGKGVKWSVGTEFTYQDWSSFKSINRNGEGLDKSWRIALGGEITPDPSALGSYLKRITYRTGVSMEQYPFLANGKEVKDLGINFGLSLPAGSSSLDLAFKVGKRGDKKDNILEESYFKVYFGITFNDQWFIKRKFD